MVKQKFHKRRWKKIFFLIAAALLAAGFLPGNTIYAAGGDCPAADGECPHYTATVTAEENGGYTTFTCTPDHKVSGDMPKYQWYRFNGYKWIKVDGAERSTYTVKTADIEGERLRCEIAVTGDSLNLLVDSLVQAFYHRAATAAEIRAYSNLIINRSYPARMQEWADSVGGKYFGEPSYLAMKFIISGEYLKNWKEDGTSYTYYPTTGTENNPRQMICDAFRFLSGRNPSASEVESWYQRYVRANKENNTSEEIYDFSPRKYTINRGMFDTIRAIAGSEGDRDCMEWMNRNYLFFGKMKENTPDERPEVDVNTMRFLYSASGTDIRKHTVRADAPAAGTYSTFSYDSNVVIPPGYHSAAGEITSGSMEPQQIRFSRTFRPKECGFTYKGFTFDGYTLVRNSDRMIYTKDGWQPVAGEAGMDQSRWIIYYPDRNYMLDRSWFTNGILSDSFTLYAQWKPKEYHIEYRGKEETERFTVTGSMEPGTFAFLDAIVPADCGFTRRGYAFAGYTVRRLSDDKRITLYAPNWQPWGGVEANTKEKRALYYPTKTYIFNWSWTFEYGTDSIWGDPEPSGGTDYIFYAVWKEQDYSIRFDGNGANGTPDGTGRMEERGYLLKPEAPYRLPANTYYRNGYEFTGWNTKADGSGTFYPDKYEFTKFNSTVKAGDAITLYAQWKAVQKYALTLKAGTGISSVSGAGSYYAGEEVTIDAAVADHYKWVNWTKPAGRFQLAYIKEKTCTFHMPAENLTLTANAAEKAKYTVSITKEKGVVSADGAGEYYVGDTVALGAELKTETGYKWWKWTGDLESEELPFVFSMPEEDVAVTAWAEAIAYRIGFDGNGADTGSMEDMECRYDAAYNLTKNAYGRQGERFTGWNTAADGSGTTYADGASVKNLTAEDGGRVTLYAQWEPNAAGYTVSHYRMNTDGTGYTLEETGTENGLIGSTVKFADLKKSWTGFTYSHGEFSHGEFSGGEISCDETDGAAAEEAVIRADGTLAINLYYARNRYTVRFDGNGATEGDMPEITVYYGQELPLPPNTYHRENEDGDSAFKGWGTSADDTEAVYQDEEEILNLSEEDGAVIMLYAVWDDCPAIKAKDLYYTLEQAQSGFVTEEELLSEAEAFDLEDGEIAPGTHPENSFRVMDYAVTDFTHFKHSGSVTETYQAIDSSGNKAKKQITVHIVDTTPEIIQTTSDKTDRPGTTRFINEKYYNLPYEMGGLEENSVWKRDPHYRALLESAFENRRNHKPEMVFEFTHEDILAMKEFIRVNGFGNTKSPDALKRFYQAFMEPNRKKGI